MTRRLHELKPEPVKLILIILLAATQVYLIPKALDGNDGFDFRLIWLAGQLWSDGISPYSESFLVRYDELFGQGPNSHFWVYPPYWWLVSRPLAVMSFESALMFWNYLNYLLLVGTAVIFAQLPLGRLAETPAMTRFAVALAVLSIVQATPFALALGQTSFLMLAGMTILLMSAGKKNHAWMALGTALIMLKPNFGTFIVLFLVTMRWTWFPIGLVAVVYFSASLLVAAQTGLQDTLASFLHNLSEYNAPHIPAGQPPNLTGIVQFADLAGIEMSTSILYVATAFLTLTVGFLVREPFEGLTCASVFCAFLIPLHTYDMAFGLLLVVVLCLQSNRAGASLGFAAAVLLLRPDNIGRSFGITHPETMSSFAGSLLASTALLLGCIVAAINIATLNRAK